MRWLAIAGAVADTPGHLNPSVSAVSALSADGHAHVPLRRAYVLP
jgi:hypothetical protein